jgi:nicotinamide mononucleotide transporter
LETYLEYTAVVFGVIYVLLAARSFVWCWPAGIISSIIYVYLNIGWQLYYDSGLQFFYVLAGIYGWVMWSRKSQVELLSISSISVRKQLLFIIAGTFVSVMLGFITFSFLNSYITFFDAAVTVFSLVATYLTAKKYLESWLWWIVIDIAAICLYFIKDANATSFLYLFFTLAAFYGYFNWKKQS